MGWKFDSLSKNCVSSINKCDSYKSELECSFCKDNYVLSSDYLKCEYGVDNCLECELNDGLKCDTC